MDFPILSICISIILLNFIIEATDATWNVSETLLEELRQPKVTGRIVKLYSGTRPEPVYCPQEGFQPDPTNCAVFYRCVKGANNKYTVFRFQCGPGTVYDPDTEVCNFPQSTRRLECGGNMPPSNEKNKENEINENQQELPSPISPKPVFTDTTLKENPVYTTAYPWQTPKPQSISGSSIRYPWITTQENKGSPLKQTASTTQKSRQEGDPCTTDGFMGDSEDCRKFYRCVGNQRGGFIKYEFSCSESTVWDDDVQSCNHPWAVQRSRCGRGNSNSDTKPSNTIEQSSNSEPISSNQQQLQISYGDNVRQTQTQISHGQVIQNQTQINYGDRTNKKKNSYSKQNQTQISYGSAVSQAQTQVSHGNGVQTQLQIDHSKQSSQAQAQVYETSSKPTVTEVTTAPQLDEQGYDQPSNPQQSPNKEDSGNQCSESGFMGDIYDCKKFYRCVDNGKGSFTKYEFSCGEGTVWDSKIEACNHAWAVQDCGGKVPQSSNQTTEDTDTTAKTTQNYQPTSGPTTSEDNEDTGYGNQNQEQESTSTITQTTPFTSTTTSSSLGGASSDNTVCQSSGFMGDSVDCKKFYRCVDNGKGSYTKYEYKCGEGTVWDPEIEACNHPWAVNKCGGSTTDIHKVETTTSIETMTITTVVLLETTTQTSSLNVDSSNQSTTTTVQPSQSESGDNNNCNSSGFMGDKNNCKKFYRCVDSGNGSYIRYEFSCGEGTVWDPKIEACNHAWAVEKCGGEDLDDVIKTTSSSRPTMSDEEIGTTSSSGQVTNQEAQSSSTSSTTEQPSSTAKPLSGNECSQEGFMGDTNDCKKFYRCVDNGHGGFIKYEYSCGEGTAWDSEIKSCNHINSVKNCGAGTPSQNQNIAETTQGSTSEYPTEASSIQSTEESKSTEKPSTTKPSGKDCSQEGFMGDDDNCKKFYRCVDNGQGGFIKYEFTCGEGTVWDPDIIACNHPSSDRRCGGTATQVSTSSTEPVKENDETYTETFSNPSQTTSVTQNPQTTTNECISEGFMSDSNNCKKFYRCVDNGNGGYTQYEFTCGDGTVWDQEIQACNHESSNPNCSAAPGGSTETTQETSTSSNEEVQQHSTEKTESPPEVTSGNCLSEGFFANPNDCKKFYRCVDNGKGDYTKYDFACGDGTVWVQEIQACDHDHGDSNCIMQSESVSSTTESNQQQSSSTSEQTITDQPDKENDENPNETSSESPSSDGSGSSDKCISEGFYPNKKDCKRFYRCVDNGQGGYTKYDFVCGEGTAWDVDIQSCNHIGEVKNCQGLSQEDNQSQPVENDETSQTDGTTTVTMTSSSGPTTESSKPSSKDTCKEEGYFGNTQDCTKFYRCVDNGKNGLTKYDFDCGEGTIWDQDITACNHPQDVLNPSCKQSDGSASSSDSTSTTSSSSSMSSSTSTTTESNNDSSDCSQGTTKKPGNKNVNCTEAGYYPDPDDCKKFYRCVDWDGDGKKFSVYHFECGEGTIWDPALDTCNHEDSVYPPRDCSGGTQSQGENVNQETTTEESSTDENTTTEQSTTEQSTTQQTTTSEQTTTEQTTTSEPTTTQKGSIEETTTQKTEQQTTTQQSTTEEITTQQATSEQSTTEQTNDQQTTTEPTTEHQTTTEQQTTTQQTTTEQTTEHQTTTEQQTSTEQQTTAEQTTEDHTSSEQTTTQEPTSEGTTQESVSTEQTTSTSDDDQQSTNEQSTTQESTTESSTDSSTTEGSQDNQSTTESNETESTTENGEQTTESSSESDKNCPETEDDQNLFVCPTSFRRHPKYCNMFYQCTEDDDNHDVQIATFHCPNNTIYDESKTQCVEEKKAEKKCDGEIAQKRRIKRLSADNKEPIVVTNERLKCPTVGHFPFENGECSPAFLKCQKAKSGKIRGFVYQCPKSHVYWAVSRRCESKFLLKDCKQSYNNWNGRSEIPIERRNVAP